MMHQLLEAHLCSKETSGNFSLTKVFHLFVEALRALVVTEASLKLLLLVFGLKGLKLWKDAELV